LSSRELNSEQRVLNYLCAVIVGFNGVNLTEVFGLINKEFWSKLIKLSLGWLSRLKTFIAMGLTSKV